MSDQPHSAQRGFANDIESRPTSGLAVSSLVLGILCLCLGPLALVPLILGIVGITQTGTNGPRKGMGLAIAGVSLGGVGLLGSCFSIGIFLPALASAKQQANSLKSHTQVRTLLQEAIIYAGENAEMYPPVESWEQILIEQRMIDPLTLISPLEDGDGVSYIYLGGENTFNADQIVIYEDPKHWPSGVIVGFADGHVELVDHVTFEQMLAEQQASD